jgi:hypothetical protein
VNSSEVLIGAPLLAFIAIEARKARGDLKAPHTRA